MISLRHLAVGLCAVDKASLCRGGMGGVMDAAAAPCSYMMEGDSQLC